MRRKENALFCTNQRKKKSVCLSQGGAYAVSVASRDQYQYLGNCPPTPPLTQKQSIDNKLGLMLG